MHPHLSRKAREAFEMRNRDQDVRVSGKNLDIGQALRGQAADRVREAVAKYFGGGFSSRVTVEREGTGFKADCTVHLDTGAVMKVSGEGYDAHGSVSQVVERIGKQLRRDKRKRTAYADGAELMDGAPPYLAEESVAAEPEIVGDARPIVAEKVESLGTMSVEDAIQWMETQHLSSYVFRNVGTGRVNILQDRRDGAIGWIDLAA
ncbi:MAG: ribosome hibernation promotion factor [Beijerinckiaceae bacterium]